MLTIKSISLRYKFAGLTALLLLVTVVALTELANHQMQTHFDRYLVTMGRCVMMGGGGGRPGMSYGASEADFLGSVHDGLYAMGGGLVALAVAAAWFFTGRLTCSLKRLAVAAREMAAGRPAFPLAVDSGDEVGRLTATFNEMAEKIERNNADRRLLLANIAHELKTPLTVIQGNVEGMLDNVVERSDENLLLLKDEVHQLSRLVSDLRDIALAENRQLSLDRRPVPVSDIVLRAVADFRPLAEEKRVRLDCNVRNPVVAEVDSGRLLQVVHNLLANALRHVRPRIGAVELTVGLADQDPDCFEIAISDNGGGIPAAHRSRIFDCFFRADGARSRNDGGTGLGLAIARQLCRAHGGDCWLAGSSGEGSKFVIRLPVRAATSDGVKREG
ncbi:MAG: HAMP domain-containing histidine kinase [Negativicutes bacterium]|nr:HAMP domain-containing histidine kinase [Negativicutes bacterium]